MKFAHSFTDALQGEEFPKRWVDAAISYRRLKKCIKDVQKELEVLGLDEGTLRSLLHDSGSAGIHYSISNSDNNIRPKLLFQIEKSSGMPLSASLSPEARILLQSLAGGNRSSGVVAGQAQQDQIGPASDVAASDAVGSRTIEVPLIADSQFFRLLSLEISRLGDLRHEEASASKEMIEALSGAILSVTNTAKHNGKNELYAWRQIFSLYLESQIFFSTAELDRSERNFTSASENFQTFTKKLSTLNVRLKKRESQKALIQFCELNGSLLRNLRFQELNVMAMTKILKKFDKRTALGAKERFPVLVAEEAFSSSALAKAVCFEISQKLVPLVPQLDDYLCPICFSISWRPIRLSIFCIRCMIVMQRSRQKNCPLCRGDVVMTADSANLDLEMLQFLKKYFPREVKAKQGQNERESAIDQWGHQPACSTM